MKKLILYALLIAGCIGCSDDYDDSKLWDSVNGLENRVEKLEELCKQMNTNISSLQEIVTALQKNESIKSVATLPDGSGYLITFSSGKTITIYHGKNGTDGKDGTTPVISVRKDMDGIYYWTVNNDWLLVDGKKVKAEGIDGTDGGDGTNGKDGTTPQFKITDGYWYISYDNELSWTKLGKATGDSGLNGSDGDNFFKGVSIEDGYVCFTLNDKDSTVIKLPFISESELTVDVKEPGTLKSLLTDEDMRTVISLKIKGSLNEDDFATIRYWMFVVENVDLSEADITEIPKNAFRKMPRLRKVILPKTCARINDSAFKENNLLSIIEAPAVQYIGDNVFAYNPNFTECIIPAVIEIGDWGFSNCDGLKNIMLPKTLTKIGNGAFENCISLTNITIPESVVSIGTTAFNGCANLMDIALPYNLENIGERVFSGCVNLTNITLPYNLKSIGVGAFSNCNLSRITFPGDCSIFGNTNIKSYFDCSNITHILFPEGLTIIPDNLALYFFPNLRTVTLPHSFQGFKSCRSVFGESNNLYCMNLYRIISKAPNPPALGYGSETDAPFYRIITEVYVPNESIESYEKQWGKTYFLKYLPIEDLKNE